jgi:hypothetical protein
MNTFNNISRKSDQYGNVHFISLYGAILSRLAYMNDNKFLDCYCKIFGPIVLPQILQGINNVSANDLKNEINDQQMFQLTQAGGSNPLEQYEYTFKNEHFLAFNALNIPKNVNIVTGEIAGTVVPVLSGAPPTPSDVKYISIGWSNYGEVYVVADKRMSKTIFLVFRGTYSAKTAALYSKPTSITPLNVGCANNEGFLYGIFKTNVELIHTTIEAMSYLATDFLGATEPNSVKVFTTGHSLGGALCSNFAYLWKGIKQTAPYSSAPYNVLSNKIICMSLGAPRCMSAAVASKFCDLVKNNDILYLRITTRGDPVPGLPPKSGYDHPCSNNDVMRQIVSEDCNANLTARGKINVDYAAALDCQNYKTRAYMPNPLSHTIYLNILYTSAVDIVNFLKGVGTTKEVERTPTNGTVCRVIIGSANNFKAGFFDVANARNTNTIKGGGFGGSVAEDVNMTGTAFKQLVAIINGSPLLAIGKLCPMSGPIVNPFINITTPAPNLSCVNALTKMGGKRMRRRTKRTRTTKKRTSVRSKRIRTKTRRR